MTPQDLSRSRELSVLITAAEQASTAGDDARARSLYDRILQLQPDHPIALRKLAWLADAAGDVNRAVALGRRLLLAQPDDARAHQDLALGLLRLSRRQEAIEHLRRTTTLAPDYSPGFCNLGLALEEEGDFAGASAALREALRLQPQSGFIAYHLAAVLAQTGEPGALPPICPPDYLIQLFDNYADRFDRHLFQTLHYRGPQLLAEIVAATPAAELPARPWDILDLGCGTGMTGVPFRESARSIVGVDLAPRMLKHARARATTSRQLVYDELIESDLLPVLRARLGRFDLILSADVFIYIGDLHPLFVAVRDALRPGGIFAFTIETWNGTGDWRLLPTRRYAQSTAYISRLAREIGLLELLRRDAQLRLDDNNQPTAGAVFLLRKPAGGN
jgi:predicted TPR repeat methyltransferase